MERFIYIVVEIMNIYLLSLILFITAPQKTDDRSSLAFLVMSTNHQRCDQSLLAVVCGQTLGTLPVFNSQLHEV